jgi:hypothetical protein
LPLPCNTRDLLAQHRDNNRSVRESGGTQNNGTMSLLTSSGGAPPNRVRKQAGELGFEPTPNLSVCRHNQPLARLMGGHMGENCHRGLQSRTVRPCDSLSVPQFHSADDPVGRGRINNAALHSIENDIERWLQDCPVQLPSTLRIGILAMIQESMVAEPNSAASM